MTSRRATAAIALGLALAMLACGGDSRNGKELPEAQSARLAGSWDVTLRLERPLTVSTDVSRLPRTVGGTLTLLPNRDPRVSFDQMHDPTHVGVYEIALDSLGFPRREPGFVPSVAARTVAGTSADLDSIHIVMDPETPRRAVHLAGVLQRGEVRGTWVAESFLGGGGTFVLRRRAPVP